VQLRRGWQPDETPHELTLSPFFIARHELTQGQWLRLASGANPSHWAVGRTVAWQRVTWEHPVDNVDWTTCDEVLRQHGMELPTEAQWEYACRARTTTPWCTGAVPASLDGFANLLDKAGYAAGLRGGVPDPFDDGFAAPAPVGSFRANAFGLFDVQGNVWEWCRDRNGAYSVPTRPGDGLRLVETENAGYVARGGGFGDPAAFARRAERYRSGVSLRGDALGQRAARAVRVVD
jgi:formylglycine-generating enzyme required for sulfatase activity